MIQAVKSYSRLLGFFLAFAVGVASVVIFRGNHIFGAIALVLVISSYAVIGTFLFGERERDAHGDSVYYLGFCLTLVGLSVGLLFKEKGGDNMQLINTFGFGLVATVNGLVARILIQNFAASFESDPADATRILSESYRDFGATVTGASRRIDAAMVDFSDHMGRSMTELSTHLQRTMAEFAQASANASDELRQQLGHQVEDSLHKIEEGVGKGLSAILLTGQKAVETINATSAQIVENMAGAGNAVADAGQKMKDSADAFKKGAAQVEKSAGNLDKAAVVVEETSERLAQNLQVLEKSTVQLRDGMNSAVEPLREMAEFHNVIVQMKDASTSIHADLQRVLAVVQSLATSAAKIQQDAEQAANEVKRIARTTAEAVVS